MVMFAHIIFENPVEMIYERSLTQENDILCASEITICLSIWKDKQLSLIMKRYQILPKLGGGE